MIRKVSKDEVEKLKSHLSFTSVTEIIKYYVREAIETFKATRMEILFDSANQSLLLIDDGDGIPDHQLHDYLNSSSITLLGFFLIV